MKQLTLKDLKLYRVALLCLQWGIVFGMPAFAVLTLCRWAGSLLPDPNGPISAAPRTFWWIVIPTTSFLACALTASIAWMILRLLSRLLPLYLRVYRWYHSTYMLKDWALIGALLACLYSLALQMVQRGIIPLQRVAGTHEDWLSQRALLLAVCVVLTISILHLTKSVQEYAVIPERVLGPLAVFLYAGLMVWSWPLMQDHVLDFILSRPADFWLIVAASVAIASFVLFLLLSIYVQGQVPHAAHSGPLPVQVTIAMIAPPKIGKTTFLARAYSKLKNLSNLGTITLQPTKESEDELRPTNRELEARRWPGGGTVEVAKVPFQLVDGDDAIVEFDWMDLPGGAFLYEEHDRTSPEYARYERQYQQFVEHLAKAEGLAMLFRAQDLAAVSHLGEYRFYNIYTKAIQDLYRRMRRDNTPRSVPLAIIVTQCCRVPIHKQAAFSAKLKDLVIYYKQSAARSSLPAPEVKIFLTSAVITRGPQHDLPPATEPIEPLRSRQCVESVAWLASRIMRNKVGLLDIARGFAIKPKSDMQQVITKLEDAV